MPYVRIPTVDEIRNLSKNCSSENMVKVVENIFTAAKNGDNKAICIDFISDKDKDKIRAMGFDIVETNEMTVIEW